MRVAGTRVGAPDVRPRLTRDQRGALDAAVRVGHVHVRLDRAGRPVRVEGPAADRQRGGLRTDRRRELVDGTDGVRHVGRRSEPVRVHPPEVAVAVGAASVAGPVQVRECGRVGLVGRVVVQSGGRRVLDVDLAAPARGVGVEPHRVHPPGDVVPPGGVGLVVLELEGRGVDLVEEAVVGRVAVGGVRAPVPGRAPVLARTGPVVGDDPLLLLEQDDHGLLAEPAGLTDLGDDLRGRFVRSPDVRGTASADGSPRRRGLPVVLQAGVPGTARRDGAVQERLHLPRGHRRAVVEQPVGDDVAGVEVPGVGRARRSGGGDHREQPRQERDDRDHDGWESTSHGISNGELAEASSEMVAEV